MKNHSLLSKLNRLRHYFRTYGARSGLRKIAESGLFRFIGNTSNLMARMAVFLGASRGQTTLRSFLYDYILNEEPSFNVRLDDCCITWIVPEYGPSSGGHRTIFRHISGLRKLGVTSRLLVLETNNFYSVQQARKNLPSDLDLSWLEIEMAKRTSFLTQTTIVTSWHTAFWARSITETQSCKAYYFIQDYESLFYASGSLAIFSQYTYELPYRHIYASDWLANIIPGNDVTKQGRHVVNLGVDSNEFFADQSAIESREIRLLNNDCLEIGIYYRPVTPRRMEEHAYLLLEFLSRSSINMRLHFFGWDWSKHDWPSESQWHKSHGVLVHSEINKLLQSLDCCILLGSTNVSLMPLETIAAGLPTFVNEGENNYSLLRDLPLYFSNLPHIGFYQIIDSLRNRRHLVAKMKHGLERVKSQSWEARSFELFRALCK
jgi:hypothetical protein